MVSIKYYEFIIISVFILITEIAKISMESVNDYSPVTRFPDLIFHINTNVSIYGLINISLEPEYETWEDVYSRIPAKDIHWIAKLEYTRNKMAYEVQLCTYIDTIHNIPITTFSWLTRYCKLPFSLVLGPVPFDLSSGRIFIWWVIKSNINKIRIFHKVSQPIIVELPYEKRKSISRSTSDFIPLAEFEAEPRDQYVLNKFDTRKSNGTAYYLTSSNNEESSTMKIINEKLPAAIQKIKYGYSELMNTVFYANESDTFIIPSNHLLKYPRISIKTQTIINGTRKDSRLYSMPFYIKNCLTIITSNLGMISYRLNCQVDTFEVESRTFSRSNELFDIERGGCKRKNRRFICTLDTNNVNMIALSSEKIEFSSHEPKRTILIFTLYLSNFLDIHVFVKRDTRGNSRVLFNSRKQQLINRNYILRTQVHPLTIIRDTVNASSVIESEPKIMKKRSVTSEILQDDSMLDNSDIHIGASTQNVKDQPLTPEKNNHFPPLPDASSFIKSVENSSEKEMNLTLLLVKNDAITPEQKFEGKYFSSQFKESSFLIQQNRSTSVLNENRKYSTPTINYSSNVKKSNPEDLVIGRNINSTLESFGQNGSTREHNMTLFKIARNNATQIINETHIIINMDKSSLTKMDNKTTQILENISTIRIPNIQKTAIKAKPTQALLLQENGIIQNQEIFEILQNSRPYLNIPRTEIRSIKVRNCHILDRFSFSCNFITWSRNTNNIFNGTK